MKPIPRDLPGKRLETVLVRQATDGRPPAGQVFLCFDDGTSYEFYSMATISPSNDLDHKDADAILRTARPETKTVGRVDAEPGQGRPTAPMDESLRTISALMFVQNEIIYVLECLMENLTGEARSSLNDVLAAADKDGVPAYVRNGVRAAAESGLAELRGVRRARECGSLLQQARRRLANEIAFRVGDKLPYAEQYYPRFSPKATG